MNCRDCRDMFDDRLDGLLDRERQGRMDAHLDDCRRCRAEWQKLKRLAGSIDVLAAAADRLAMDDSVAASVAPRRLPLRWSREMTRAAVAAIFLATAGTAIREFIRGPSVNPHRQVAVLNVAGNSESATHQMDRLAAPVSPASFALSLPSDDTRVPLTIETAHPRIHVVWLYQSYDRVPDAAPNATPDQISTTPENKS